MPNAFTRRQFATLPLAGIAARQAAQAQQKPPNILFIMTDEHRADALGCMGNAVIEPEVVRAMAEAGCRAIKCGVESGDPEVLRRIPKKQNPADVRRTVADCDSGD